MNILIFNFTDNANIIIIITTETLVNISINIVQIHVRLH